MRFHRCKWSLLFLISQILCSTCIRWHWVPCPPIRFQQVFSSLGLVSLRCYRRNLHSMKSLLILCSCTMILQHIHLNRNQILHENCVISFQNFSKLKHIFYKFSANEFDELWYFWHKGDEGIQKHWLIAHWWKKLNWFSWSFQSRKKYRENSCTESEKKQSCSKAPLLMRIQIKQWMAPIQPIVSEKKNNFEKEHK